MPPIVGSGGHTLGADRGVDVFWGRFAFARSYVIFDPLTKFGQMFRNAVSYAYLLQRRATMVLGQVAAYGAISAALPRIAAAQAASANTDPTLVGAYDGGQSEVAAGLELGRDGRFRYGLSYGALDEEASGTWSVDGSTVLLTSDPVTPPRFILLDQKDATAPHVTIGLEVPEGLSQRYFRAEVELANGMVIDRQLSDDRGSLKIDVTARPKSVTLTMPIADLRSDVVRASGATGQDLRFRFEPNDIGKVAFARTALPNDNGILILIRHGRTIRFRSDKGIGHGRR